MHANIRSLIVCLLVCNPKTYRLQYVEQTYNVVCYVFRVRNLVFRFEGRTWTGRLSEQGAEENIWFQPFGAQLITGGFAGNSRYKLRDLSFS